MVPLLRWRRLVLVHQLLLLSQLLLDCVLPSLDVLLLTLGDLRRDEEARRVGGRGRSLLLRALLRFHLLIACLCELGSGVGSLGPAQVSSLRARLLPSVLALRGLAGALFALCLRRIALISILAAQRRSALRLCLRLRPR